MTIQTILPAYRIARFFVTGFTQKKDAEEYSGPLQESFYTVWRFIVMNKVSRLILSMNSQAVEHFLCLPVLQCPQDSPVI